MSGQRKARRWVIADIAVGAAAVYITALPRCLARGIAHDFANREYTTLSILRRFVYFSALITAILWAANAYAGVKFQPVSQEELKMTSEPLVPGAPAIILYREVQRDDCGITCHSTNVGIMSTDMFENNYFRIKILTDAGRKYGDVEIPLPNEVGTVDDINARTIRPDGSIVNFNGRVFEKTIYKAKGFKYLAKTFTMPDVQVGSILEYYYRINFSKGLIFDSNWVLSQELFTKKAKFWLRPFQSDYYQISFRWSEHLPAGTASPKLGSDGNVELEALNIAAFQAEDFMPPENELKARVDFIYSSDPFEPDANRFWKNVGKNRFNTIEKFVGKRGAMERAAAQIVSPSDPPEVKLRKMYARVQQLHNTTYEAHKTEQEQQREKTTTDQNVEDVWKRGSGRDWELTWVYLALVRSAGFEAYPVLVADRRNFFFNPQTMQSGRLDANLVVVKLDGKDLYLDPGGAFTPFGMLRWDETGVPGLKLDKDGGTWIQTNLTASSESLISRKANLKLLADGSLEGRLTVTYTGLEALRRRVDEGNEDQAARKTNLENEVKEYVPAASDVELTKPPDWANSELPLVAEFNMKIPGWSAMAGQRSILPVGIFGAPEKHVFEYSTRVHPIYFDYRCEKADDITIEVPSGWQIASLPKAQSHDLHAVAYSATADNNSGTLHLVRKLDINSISIDQKYYDPLRNFYQGIKAADEQQVILLQGATTSSN